MGHIMGPLCGPMGAIYSRVIVTGSTYIMIVYNLVVNILHTCFMLYFLAALDIFVDTKAHMFCEKP